MFKLQSTFVTLALVGAVVSRPFPAPSQELSASGDLAVRALPGLDIVSGLLGAGGGDDSSDDSGSSDGLGGLLSGILKRHEELTLSEDGLPGLDIVSGLLGGGGGDDSADAGDDSGSDGLGGLLGGILKRQDDSMSLDDIESYLDGLVAARQDDDDDDDDDAYDPDNENNERRDEALKLPLLGGGGGGGGILASLGLGGLGKTLSGLVAALGQIIGQLL